MACIGKACFLAYGAKVVPGIFEELGDLSYSYEFNVILAWSSEHPDEFLGKSRIA